MFTGLVESVSRVKALSKRAGGARIEIERPEGFDDLKVGDSVAVDGVCLTAVEVDAPSFTADVSEETLGRSTLGGLSRGDRVNLERAMSASSRFGGHMVSGHVDATVALRSKQVAGASTIYRFELPAQLGRLVVDKGSVTVAGVSLTVSHLDEATFSVAVIPHTEQVTTLGSLNVGDRVNFEADLIGKYVVRALDAHVPTAADDSRLLELLADY